MLLHRFLGDKANCWLYDLLAWTYIPIHAARLKGEKNRCRVGVGIPFGKGAANGGQVAVEIVSQKLQDALNEYPVLRQNFGGKRFNHFFYFFFYFSMLFC